MQCPAIGSCLIEEFCGTYYQQGVPPCASKLVEAAPSASANTGSPKLADEVLEAIRCVNRGDYESCINVLSGVVGQLRASA
jgi:hypothetical protein